MNKNIMFLLILIVFVFLLVVVFEVDGEKECESIEYGLWKVKVNYMFLGCGEVCFFRDVMFYIDGIWMCNCVQSGFVNVDLEGNIICVCFVFIDEYIGDCGFF